jgi:hypothetical protein
MPLWWRRRRAVIFCLVFPKFFKSVGSSGETDPVFAPVMFCSFFSSTPNAER